MGGFEGGDEGGFWDIDTPPNLMYKPKGTKSKNPNSGKTHIEKNDQSYSIRAYARVAIFLKVTNFVDDIPNLSSRLVRVENLYDAISIVPATCSSFTVEGCDEIAIENNSIYKAYEELLNFTNDSDIESFFYDHKVVVKKEIPMNSGLGGSASDAAAFIHLTKEMCNLVLTSKELLSIAHSINSDVPYFISNFTSANVSGYGEIVEAYDEEALNIELYHSDILCDKDIIYQTLKEEHLHSISPSSFKEWDTLTSKSIIELISDPIKLNDFYAASLLAYPELRNFTKEAYLVSGSTFFKVLN
jgi:4-diphosphocytidyl-2-C-methyl-D-erythritol kinase